ncbi:Methyltransferase domain-containing protein [Madurella fahalii]|uniref:Methyltransferase domain-containing protein n=1 Tax=Madurella fahalii TaxID=1157608 RepID=A0ABQ0GK93_9PEZI
MSASTNTEAEASKPSQPVNAADDTLSAESKRVGDQYGSLESRILWDWLCGGNRHMAYYEAGTWWPFPLSEGQERMQGKLLEALGLPPGSRVLDAGCGDGYVAMHLARRGSLHVTAFDVVDRHVANARRNVDAAGLGGRVTAMHLGFDQLGTIPDASHDGIYTSEALVHASDPARVLREFLRILKPGGRIVLHEYHNDFMDAKVVGFPAEIARMKTNVAPQEGDSNTPAFVRVKTYFTKVMSKTGFENIVVRNYSSNIEPMARLLSISAWWRYIVLLFHLQRFFPNSATRAEGYVGQEHWAYVSVSGTKPMIK